MHPTDMLVPDRIAMLTTELAFERAHVALLEAANRRLTRLLQQQVPARELENVSPDDVPEPVTRVHTIALRPPSGDTLGPFW